MTLSLRSFSLRLAKLLVFVSSIRGVSMSSWGLLFFSVQVYFFIFVGGAPQAIGFDETQLEKLKSQNACEGCDLTKANLSGANLSAANMAGANLSGANLSEANLIGADLSGARLKKANLSGAILRGSNLSGVDLSKTSLKNTNMNGAILCHTKLRGGEDNTGCE